MRRRAIISALMMSAILGASHLYADAASQPATMRASGISAATATAPATTRAATQTATTARKPLPAKVAVFELSAPLQERPSGFQLSLFGGGTPKGPVMSQLITKLNKAARDPNIQGIQLELKSFSLSLSQAQELGNLLSQVRKAKKRVVVYSTDFDTATYIVASHADTIIMPEQGDVMIPGVNFSLMFMRGLLDKVHIEPDFIQIGKFKGAEESFTRTAASPEYRAQIEGLADGFYDQITRTISQNRGLSLDEAKAVVDMALLTGKQAKERGLVDHLMNDDELADWLDEQFKNGTELVEDYGDPKKRQLDTSNPFAIFQMLSGEKKSNRTSQPAVAVIYADAEITGDTPGQGDDASVTPARIKRDVERALEDRLIKAIVVRVDSPGGSAFASDQIWQILKSADEHKPVTISMGRVAASGGYYISCAGRSITADPATITGSIGVVGGKFVISGLLNWAGISVEPVSRGKRAQMLSSSQKFTDDERAFMTQQMTDVYQLFLSRVRDSRKDKIKDIEQVNQGRLFTGEAALKAGLVDQVGTLNDVILAAAKNAKIDKNYQVLTYPEARTLADILREGFSIDSRMPADLQAAFRLMPPDMQRAALRLWRISQQLEHEQIMTVFMDGMIERSGR